MTYDRPRDPSTNCGGAFGPHRIADDPLELVMETFDGLPLAVRQAIREAAGEWAVPHLAAIYHDAVRRYGPRDGLEIMVATVRLNDRQWVVDAYRERGFAPAAAAWHVKRRATPHVSHGASRSGRLTRAAAQMSARFDKSRARQARRCARDPAA